MLEGFVAVCRAEDVRDGRALAAEVDGIPLAVFRDGEDIHVLSARCPHANGPLDRGWVEDGEVVCPLHRWRFRLSTGRCTSVRGESVHRFKHEVVEGQVRVRMA